MVYFQYYLSYIFLKRLPLLSSSALSKVIQSFSLKDPEPVCRLKIHSQVGSWKGY